MNITKRTIVTAPDGTKTETIEYGPESKALDDFIEDYLAAKHQQHIDAYRRMSNMLPNAWPPPQSGGLEQFKETHRCLKCRQTSCKCAIATLPTCPFGPGRLAPAHGRHCNCPECY